VTIKNGRTRLASGGGTLSAAIIAPHTLPWHLSQECRCGDFAQKS
jgi:hypothetical protein